jgi:hypothetical protein
MAEKHVIKNRNVVIVIIFSIITLGIYSVYWTVSTRRDIVSRGGDIPTAWLIIIPFANIYFFYKYSRAASKLFKKEGDWVAYFVFFLFFSLITQALVQNELNVMAR